MALSPAEMQEAIIRNLPAKTGKTLEQWIAIVEKMPVAENKAIVKALKEEHQLGHVQATTIAWRAKGEKPYINTDGYVERLFNRPEHRALYDEIKRLAESLGQDARAKPCKTYIPFYRKNQFALATVRRGRFLLGLHLPEGGDPQGLSPAKALGGSPRINYSREVHTQADIDEKLIQQLRLAYENS